jgi:hypothetical protein
MIASKALDILLPFAMSFLWESVCCLKDNDNEQ